MKKRKGFTLIEIVLATILFSVLGMAAGSLYYLHGKLIKDVTSRFEGIFDAETALWHMKTNIANSAWAVLITDRHIELHSHSAPAIREYSLEDDKLLYKEGNKKSLVLARGVNALQLFKGTGEAKPGNRFHELEVEFWIGGEKNRVPYDKDTFYTNVYVPCMESWDVVYVDPDRVSSVKDGTKRFPFATLSEAAEAACSDSTFPEEILVLSGDTSIVGELEIRNNTYFSPDTSLTLAPGSTLKLGGDVTFYLRGDFKIENAAITAIIQDDDHRWGRFVIANDQENIDFINADISWSGREGIYVTYGDEMDAPRIVTILNSNIHDMSSSMYFHYINSLIVKNSTFINNGGSISLTAYSWGEGEQAEVLIDKNLFEGGGNAIYMGCGYNKANTQISNNIFKNIEEAIDITGHVPRSATTSIVKVYGNSFQGSETAIVLELHFGRDDYAGFSEYEIYGNEILIGNPESVPYGGFGITVIGGTYSYYGTYPNINSRVTIRDNIIDGQGAAYYGLQIGTVAPVLICNNDISNTRKSRYYGYGYYDNPTGIFIQNSKDVTIRNNVMHSNSCRDITLYGGYISTEGVEYKNNALIENNIMYDSGGILTARTRYYYLYTNPMTISNVKVVNNTLVNASINAQYGGADGISIKNCIIWTNNPIGDIPPGRVSYSVLKGLDLGGTNSYTGSPPFQNLSGHDYHLTDPNWKTGDDGTQVGAYGGAYGSW
ncbi:MAG: prepilin-type N-terminal cleavage/methylation domain-containing protein [Candidatus Omnitrophica bacterium]|nr:prepilin-type N-terminal cleavage/methylation domain-containing protein [Candidatus Omnitrophota bacterium]